MAKSMELKKGINLGGYLSQCIHTKEHYETFIQESDIQRIAGWGFDHIRVPVDYNVLETDDGEIKPEGYKLLRTLHAWAHKYNLNMIIDLHKAYGYDFNNAGDAEKNNLFHNEYLQERFVALWQKIVWEFGQEEDIAFELLNEVVENDNAEAWNNLIEKTVAAIRKITNAPIIYGGIQWNSAKTLKLLTPPKYDNIIYTFHFYEPLIFTHQKAHWIPELDKTRTVNYPDNMAYYKVISSELPEQGLPVVQAKATDMGPAFLEEMMEEAVLAAEKAGVGLYCGEFGVIDQAPADSAARWLTDTFNTFHKFHIGYALWNYKEKDFGLLDPHYDEVRESILSAS